MSDMYRTEVPQYRILLDLVAESNQRAMENDPKLADSLRRDGEIERLNLERHGANRLGTAHELVTIARVFRVMDMHPVGYYDLTVAGIPVHSTAFRPLEKSRSRNRFLAFTSLPRLELIEDQRFRQQASDILSRRRIFADELLRLLDVFDERGF
jgi:uncharacterized glyoxalase superfamily metalloenzyme YdcJ